MVFALLRPGSRKVVNAVLNRPPVSGLRGWLRSQSGSAPAAATGTAERPTLQANADTEADLELARDETRKRLDALLERLRAIEASLESLNQRAAVRSANERRAEQRAIDRIDDLSDAIERRNLELDSIAAAITRVERRIERSERRAREGVVLDDDRAARTESNELAGLSDRPELVDGAERRTSDARRASRNAPEDAPELWDVGAFSTSSMRGNLAEVSLPTILGMLELERQTGVFKICAEDGSIVSATLHDGSLVGARVNELATDPVSAVREALRFKRGHFWFRQLGIEVAMGPPRSVGSVLLEATRQNDEALRSA